MAGGRPTKYKEEYPEQARKICLLGADDIKLAAYFEVNVDSIYEWKKKHPEFSEAIKNGKIGADVDIASSLYNRAKGMTVVTQKAFKVRTGNGSEEKMEVVDIAEELPPDPTSMIFWLKNRNAEYWREKKHLEVDDLRGKQDDELDSELKELIEGSED